VEEEEEETKNDFDMENFVTVTYFAS